MLVYYVMCAAKDCLLKSALPGRMLRVGGSNHRLAANGSYYLPVAVIHISILSRPQHRQQGI